MKTKILVRNKKYFENPFGLGHFFNLFLWFLSNYFCLKDLLLLLEVTKTSWLKNNGNYKTLNFLHSGEFLFSIWLKLYSRNLIIGEFCNWKTAKTWLDMSGIESLFWLLMLKTFLNISHSVIIMKRSAPTWKSVVSKSVFITGKNYYFLLLNVNMFFK